MIAVLLNPPLQPGRDDAAEAARRELSKSIYQQAQPSWVEKIFQWLMNAFQRALRAVSDSVPGGLWGLFLLILLFVLVLVLIRWRSGGLARSAASGTALFVGSTKTAAQHRAAADRAAASGNWDEAVRERFRAVVRDLEERAILDERPGRTADEAAAEGGRALASCAVDLRAGATVFDDIAYGSVAASPVADRQMRDLDLAVRAARRTPTNVLRQTASR